MGTLTFYPCDRKTGWYAWEHHWTNNDICEYCGHNKNPGKMKNGYKPHE